MALLHLDSVDAALAWLARQGVGGLATDSRQVTLGDAFIAWPGYAVDGRRFVSAALAAGARACLVEADGAEAAGQRSVTRPAAVVMYGSHQDREARKARWPTFNMSTIHRSQDKLSLEQCFVRA